VSPRPYDVLGSRVVLSNPFLRVREDKVRGRETEGLHYVVELPRAATIVPVLDDGRLLMIRQYRHSVGRAILELPGGRVDPAETPEAAARRELVEETGYEASTYHSLGSFIPAAGISDHVGHLFEARGLRRVERRLEAFEEIDLVPMPWEDVARALASGEIDDAFCLVGLFRFFLRHGRVAGGLAPDAEAPA
jgi:ADP-ribose pyrophosphatase